MYNKYFIIKSIVLFFIGIFFSSFTYAQNIFFDSGTITVGKCVLDVYIAKTWEQKINGMLGFSEDTFLKDGMIFIGSKEKEQYYHTVGMKINIRIMGVKTIGKDRYMVNGEPIYAPIGLSSIRVYGDSVFETTESLYQKKIKYCLFKNDE